MIIRVITKLYNVFWNILTWTLNAFIRRSDRVVLVGSWMGEKFADNSRYLFQYLFKNKEKLNLDRVIWVTRNIELKKQLSQMGYEAYVIGTKESNYWHLKSGYHILCNAAIPGKIGDPMDIDIRFSWGAKRIQLWHGVGMKATGHASNALKKAENGKKNLQSRNKYFLKVITSLGGWKKLHFLCTSRNNAEVNMCASGCKVEDLFISSYPRNCECIELLPNEIEIINKIQRYNKCIIYVPTFRSNHSQYIHPLVDESVKKCLVDKNILWIEKPHSASTFSIKQYEGIDNVLVLEAEFDINVLYPYVDIVISDYSSTVFDAAYKNIPVIMYTPDLFEFMNGDIGFVFDVPVYCDQLIAMNISDCLKMIDQIVLGLYFTTRRIDIYKNINQDYFDNRRSEYDEIWNAIVELK